MKKGGVLLFLTIFLLPVVFGHVGYVIEDEEFTQHAGTDAPYLIGALLDPINIVLIIVTLVVSLSLYFYLPKVKPVFNELSYINKRVKSYDVFIPWIARLGLGIALIGAGSARVLVSPILETGSVLSLIQIIAGFFLLAGLLVGPMLWVVLILYAIGLFQDFYLVGNLDYVALSLTVLAYCSPKPGIDDIFGIKFCFPLKKLKEYVPTILRLGIGIAMTFLALYEKLLNPHLSRLVVEQYQLTSAIPVSAEMWVLSAGLIELAVGLALLFGLRTRLFSAIAFVVLSASFFYFNEAVFSHITLFATLSLLFVTGAGKLSIDEWLDKKLKKKRR